MRLRLPSREMELEAGAPVLMGIVNASPDSFSDGGDLPTLDDQVARGLELLTAGAAIIDVGGESGVTNTPVSDPEAEAALVVPLVRGLAEAGVIVSVDTWKPLVADRVLAAGASIINDVSGLRDPALADVCASHRGALVLMHTRAAPKVKEFPIYDDVRADVVSFLEERMAMARAAGLDDDQIVLDPGPDFAKTPAQTIDVLRHLDDLAHLARPILLAVSRKDFVGALTMTAPQDRGAGTLAAVADGLDRGASILRVHDVAGTAAFLRVRAAMRGDVDVATDLHLPEHLRRRRS